MGPRSETVRPDYRSITEQSLEKDLIHKSASAQWSGGLEDGSGTIATESGALTGIPYSYTKRFEGETGSNPEELVGAAHPACFAMLLSALMGGAGLTGTSVSAKSTISMDPATEGSPTITAAHLTVAVKADAPEATVRELAEKAKQGCPVSKLLKAEITMELTVG